jgi:hypothetical protein
VEWDGVGWEQKAGGEHKRVMVGQHGMARHRDHAHENRRMIRSRRLIVFARQLTLAQQGGS